MRSATAILCLLTISLAAWSLTASAQERATSSADAPVAAPKPANPDAGHPPLLRADSELRVFADAQNVHTTASISYTPLRGSVDEVRLVLPRSERLLGISLNGATPPHEIVTDGNFTSVAVRLPSRVRNPVSLEIHTQKPRSGSRLDLGGESEDEFIRPLDVLQSHGILLLACDPAFDLLIDETRGLVETAESNASAEAGSRCFRFYGQRLRLGAALLPAAPQVHTHQDARYSLHEGELRLDSVLTCEATGAGLFDLRLELPEAFVLEEVRVNGEPTTCRTDERVLALSFAGARRKVHIGVTGRSAWQSVAEQTLPLVRPVDAASSTGTIAIASPAGFDVQLKGDGLSPPDSGRLTPAGAAPNNACTRAWEYQTAPASIQVSIVRAQPRVSAHLESDVRLHADHAAVSALLEYDIRQTGTRVFRFALPECAEAVQIHERDGPARILQRTQGEADHPGWTAWTLWMNRDVLGTQKFRVSWTVPLEHGHRGSHGTERRLGFSPPRVLAPSGGPTEVLEEAVGKITIRGHNALAASVGKAAGGLKREAAEGDCISFQHDNSPAELEIGISPGEPVAASALVSKALIEIRPVTDGPADYECRYRLQSHPRRLPIQLPAGSEPLSVLFEGAPVPLVRASEDAIVGDYDAYEIDLSHIEPSVAQKLLLVSFRTPLDGSSLTRRRGSLAAPLPLLGELNGRTVAIAETRTCVWLPEHLAVIGTPRGFTRADRNLNDSRWIAETPAAASSSRAGVAHVFQSQGRPEAISIACWDRTLATWLLGGAAFLIALVLRPTAGENRLTMILLGAVGLSLLSLLHPHAVAQGLFAARWGVVAAAILWAASAAQARLSRRGESPGASGPVAAVISPASAAESRPQFRRGA